jgi:hypothetical protein
MAFTTSVNGGITDSVTQAGVAVLGNAPAIAMGNLYTATSQALANSAHWATDAQQKNARMAEAATILSVATLHRLTEQLSRRAAGK